MNQKKILLIDDDPISLQVLINYLQKNNYAFTTALNGLLGWELLQQNPDNFSVIITDRIMPGLHGLQLLEKMQAHEKLKNIPFILVTGEAEKAEHIAAIKAGVFDFLYKPVAEAVLLGVLGRIKLS